MAEDRLSTDAGNDLTDIYHYGCDSFGVHAADKYLTDLQKFISKYAEYPYAGSSLSVKDVHNELRFLTFKKSLIILYFPRPYGIFVLRILRAERVVKAHLLTKTMAEEK